MDVIEKLHWVIFGKYLGKEVKKLYTISGDVSMASFMIVSINIPKIFRHKSLLPDMNKC